MSVSGNSQNKVYISEIQKRKRLFVHNLLYIINILDIPTKKNNPLFSNVQMQILIEQVTFDDIMIMLVLYKTNMHVCYSITSLKHAALIGYITLITS